MITSWIDALAKLWEIDDGKGKLVKSYRVFERNEFPEAISEFPAAITYPTGVQPQYSVAGPTILIWEGVTEFHLAGNVQLTNIPYTLAFFDRILKAAAGSMTLGGTVAYFEIPNEANAISLVEFEFGSGPSHRGLLVRWRVKENVSGQITVAA